MSNIFKLLSMDFDDYLLSDEDYDDSDKSSDENDNSFQNESLNDYPLRLLNNVFPNHNDHQMEECVEDDVETNAICDKTPTVERSSKQMEITFSNLQNLRREDTCDVTIVCKERKFPAHRLVLRAGSSYFEAMFTCGLQETTASVINLPTIDENSMAVILDFLYIQKVDITGLEVNELLDLISSSHSIEIFPLFEMCCQVLAKNINVNNWEIILKVGTKYENKAILDDIIQYLVISFDWDSANDTFWNLDVACFEKLVSSTITARYHSADAILKLIMRWITVDSGEREKYLNTLISHVDFGSISREALDDFLMNNTLVSNNFSICRLLLEKVTSVFNDPLSYKSVLSSPKLLLPRGDVIESFDIKTRKWETKTLPTFLYQKYSAVTESTVYFVGNGLDCRGYQENDHLTVIAYYPHTNCLNSIVTSHPLRKYIGVTATDKFLYVIGGSDRVDKAVEMMEKFDTERKTWTALAAPIIHRYNPHLLAFDEFILLVGGYQSRINGQDDTTQNAVRIIEKYYIKTNQWTVLTTIPGKNIKSFSVAPFCHKIYIRSSNMFYEYDIRSDKWQSEVTELKLDNVNNDKWDLCSSPKPLPFLIIEELTTSKFYKLDPHCKQCVYLSDKPPRSTRLNSFYGSRDLELKLVVFA